MKRKLIVNIDQEILEKAEKYAAFNNTNLSLLIEDFFKEMTSLKEKTNGNIVEKLSGIIELNSDNKWKEDYINHLIEKHK